MPTVVQLVKREPGLDLVLLTSETTCFHHCVSDYPHSSEDGVKQTITERSLTVSYFTLTIHAVHSTPSWPDSF